jgi:hypothetical protein
LLADVEYARQMAITRRTTVYMVFVPPNYWNQAGLTPLWRNTVAATNLVDKQMTGYTFITKRSVGDQPGRESPRYLTPWRTLPEGMFIAPAKFTTLPNRFYQIPVTPDPVSGKVPVTIQDQHDSVSHRSAPGTSALHRVQPPRPGNADRQLDEFIPLARGSVVVSKHPQTKALQFSPPSVLETPPANSTNAYLLVHIDWLTGRPRLEKQEFAP